ncbi:MAG: galactokinase [Deltaproteobacteria bacterium]|nr:galactokinase [Deltaproteobacteria bacterium]
MEIYRNILKSDPIEASAPCRIDMGGTLDIKSFHLPLRRLSPCTVNAAISMRTRVRILPGLQGQVKVSSAGFESVSFPEDAAPYNHPLGLMFAIATYFGVSGIHIDIASASPPRSALGGSSAAAIALVAALSRLLEKAGQKPLTRKQIVLLAHAIEESVAGVPCGFQDQLAAAYGGVNAWYWENAQNVGGFRRKALVGKSLHDDFSRHILVAYCGIPHESRQINRKWVDQFIQGTTRKEWIAIADHTHRFSEALQDRQYKRAGNIMNLETAIRRSMTPDVLDDTGIKLIQAAKKQGCGGRFTGAGGGGCIWAIGEISDIDKLRNTWKRCLAEKKGAHLLDVRVDSDGLIVE